ncbi:unnamed protein product [Protopolystoma xenopodis]|uniref:Uncharacterized protein n=1 Tax=Protopolystoma xenopodis TaxID=117903 RepID=A0A448X6K2_9PLAT|nr:unnamed protein product [Protopolystoma xenopodis]
MAYRALMLLTIRRPPDSEFTEFEREIRKRAFEDYGVLHDTLEM